jgi:argonaute-like protein implicated in RNA metabolism and viral defense
VYLQIHLSSLLKTSVEAREARKLKLLQEELEAARADSAAHAAEVAKMQSLLEAKARNSPFHIENTGISAYMFLRETCVCCALL